MCQYSCAGYQLILQPLLFQNSSHIKGFALMILLNLNYSFHAPSFLYQHYLVCNFWLSAILAFWVAGYFTLQELITYHFPKALQTCQHHNFPIIYNHLFWYRIKATSQASPLIFNYHEFVDKNFFRHFTATIHLFSCNLFSKTWQTRHKCFLPIFIIIKLYNYVKLSISIAQSLTKQPNLKSHCIQK